MKKTILILTVLAFTIPVMADTVTITAEDLGEGWVQISYQVSDANLVRAFALDINVSDGNIVDINDYFVGECNGSGKGYGIFLGRIVIEENGDVNDYGNPVAPGGDPGAQPGLGNNAITIEMGSLYADSNHAPEVNGVLCTVLCDTLPTILCVTVEEAARGGIVMENVAIEPVIDINDGVIGDCITVGGGCPCAGDISSGIGPGVTDSNVSLSDTSYLLQMLANYGPGYKICDTNAPPNNPDVPYPIPAGYECADVSSGIGPGVTDNCLSLSDSSYMLQYLAGYGPGYKTGCICKNPDGTPYPCPE